ncbi:hypothetical protein BGZ76_009236, partial [Entomortierella beljakovae]
MATIHKIVKTSNAPAALGPYSQAVVANGFVFCSGSIGMSPVDGTIPEGVVAQTEQVFANLASILKEAGTTFAHAVRLTVFLKDLKDFDAVNKIYAQ